MDYYTDKWPPTGPRMLAGGNGTGKTHLAVGALFRFWQNHGQRGRFWPAIELLDRYRATFDDARATESAESIDAEMRRTPIIVIDDLGAGKGSEWAEERLFRLIDERYRDNGALIVTTNLTLMELPARIASRLQSGVLLQLRGADRRAS